MSVLFEKRTDLEEIAATMDRLGDEIFGAYVHATNGTYVLPAEKLVPTTLASFECVLSKAGGRENTLLIAVNSDLSMQKIMAAKKASPQECAAIESQEARAFKIAYPLSLMHPESLVVVLFYDDLTPTPLYDRLAEAGVNFRSIFKGGYGTDPNGPKIEGTHNFPNVFGFPLPNDQKALCHDITVCENQSDVVKVMKLSEEIGRNGKPYLSPDGSRVLFTVPDALRAYAAEPASSSNVYEGPKLVI